MALISRIFGVTWQQMQAKVRYRILILTLLPILLTLVSLVFITIYWNISYTGQQLFMKVKADLTVARNTLANVQDTQEKQLARVMESWEFQEQFHKLTLPESKAISSQHIQGHRGAGIALGRMLLQKKQQLDLDFLRLISAAEVSRDSDLRVMLAKSKGKEPYSGLMVLSSERLRQLDASLVDRANIPILQTLRAQMPKTSSEQRGLLSRSLLPIKGVDGRVDWYLDGGILINRDSRIVDHIRDLVYDKGTLPERSIGTVTIFLDNVRVSTNVPLNFFAEGDKEQGRALGSLVSEEVRQQVLEQGQLWVDRAFVFNDWFISAYAPLMDIQGQRIGMIYAGFSESPFIHNYLLNIIELGGMLMIVLLVSGLLVYRGAYSLLLPIEKIHHVVKAVQSGTNLRIGSLGLDRENELSNLAEQFDRMLDLLQHRNAQIQAAAEQLEMKVEERTSSLQEKTQELERNVALLNETRQQLVTNEKLTALGELTAGIAHEINNPTAVILGNMELLKYELGDKAVDVQEEIDIVIQQVGRISTIIRSLLQYSRPGEFNAPLEMHQVTPIIEEMLVLVRHSIKKQEVKLNQDLQASYPVQVNRPQLLQVLINLVVNATHAIDEQGQIWIRTYDWNQSGELVGVKIEIEDEGGGIPPELLGRIFDPFYTTRKDGTGLGLSLSYGIIKRIGGTIEVSSTLGKGTLFTIGLYHQAREQEQDSQYKGLQLN